jgi:hypothetical protein
MSFLTKTLVGFAQKYRQLRDEHPATVERTRFEFISNRVQAGSFDQVLADLGNGIESAAAARVRKQLDGILDPHEVADLCRRLRIDGQTPSLLRQRHLLELHVADLLPGAPGEQALLLREMISSRANSITGDRPAVHREDVLAALKTSEHQIFPAPNHIEAPPIRSLDNN